MTAADIREALRNRYKDTSHYAIAEEVGLQTGFSHRRLDMVVIDCWQSYNYRIDGFEIKISTGDLRHELQDPEKHIAFFDRIDYYTLAVPKGVVEPVLDLIPKRWGILIINEDGTSRFKRKPLALEDRKADKDVPRGFFAGIIRQIQNHHPGSEELAREFQKGFDEGQKHNKRREERLKLNEDKLDAYNKLQDRFRLWGREEKLDRILDEFEAFRKLNKDYLIAKIDKASEALGDLRQYIEKNSTQEGD